MPISALKRGGNGRDKALPSKSSEVGQVDSNHQGTGPEVPSVTFNLTRASTPNRRHSRRSRWAERGGCTFPNMHILASDHEQYVSSNWAHGDDTAILGRKLWLRSGRTICYPEMRCSEDISPQTSGPARAAADAQSQPEPDRPGLPSHLSSVFADLRTRKVCKQQGTVQRRTGRAKVAPGPSPGHLHAV